METTFRSFSGTERVNYAKNEEETLEYWTKIKAFETQLKLSEGKPPYTFYDGPPFATGLPHYGHILAGTIKDVVTRYQTQNGRYVERRFGWDCHGVPIEFEIEKKHKISGREQILEMGIDKYNSLCRGIVTRYTAEWEKTVKRCGRWIDFENDYKTMDLSYMESVWWVFKTIFDKDLVYQGFKVMPYSTALNTPLSNFESRQNMKDVVDPAVVVTFPIVGDKDNAAFLAWTTTPWTLPSNLALCVNPSLMYVKLRVVADANVEGYFYQSGDVFVMMKDRLEEMFPEPKKKKKKGKWPPYEIISEIKGKDLVGTRYVPLFDYFKDRGQDDRPHKPNFIVVSDLYVTADAGTGVVHQAPGFGEDDYRVCLREGLITPKVIPCPIDHNGRFTSELKDTEQTGDLGLTGTYVKDADKSISKFLKNAGRLKKQGTLKHSYPLCWRSDTPLLYRTVACWFIEVTKIKEDLVARNKETYWVPDFVKEKRFHNWLEGAIDWCVSRNRYWGTPIPIWMNEEGEKICVGSVAELEALTGEKVNDLHMESINHLEIPSPTGKSPLKRVEEVLDCWFESGAMPYAQQHYMGQNEEEFLKKFPADFIAEGLDQTRGWFYTLMVLSTALFDKPAFKNLIVNGLVLAENGKKMSKRLKNFPPPEDILNKHGADALRVYLMNSPVVRAEPLKFSEQGVRDVVKDLFNPWYNSYKLFVESSCRFELEGSKFIYNPDELKSLKLGPLDLWILSRLQTLTKEFRKEMDAYRLSEVIPNLDIFLSELSTKYVRFNKDAMKGYEGEEKAAVALSVTFHLLFTTCRLMAPFTPFIVENMYQNLKNALIDPPESIHYWDIPQVDESFMDADLEARFAALGEVMKLTRNARDQVEGVPTRYPLGTATIVSPDPALTAMIQIDNIFELVKEDCNLQTLEFSNEMTDWIRLECVPNNRALGRRLGKKSRDVKDAMRKLSQKDMQTLKAGGKVTVLGEEIDGTTDCEIHYLFQGDSERFTHAQEGGFLVVLDKSQTPELYRAGLAAEIRSQIQQLRKKSNLAATDKVWVYYKLSSDTAELEQVLSENIEDIQSRVRCPLTPSNAQPRFSNVLGEETKKFNKGEITVTLVSPCARLTAAGTKKHKENADALDQFLANKNYRNLKRQAQAGGDYVIAVNGEEVKLDASDLNLSASR